MTHAASYIPVSEGDSFEQRTWSWSIFAYLFAFPDIKPQNILIETSAIRDMFENAPSEAFQPDGGARDGPVIESVQVSSAEEDLAQSTNISIKLADFGTGEVRNRSIGIQIHLIS